MKVAFLILILTLTACAQVEQKNTSQVAEPAKKVNQSYAVIQKIGDEKFILCHEDCDQFTEKELSLVEPTNLSEQTVLLQPGEVKVNTQSFRVHFEFGSSRLNDLNKSELAIIQHFLIAHQMKQLSILGKTDPIGTNGFNQKLALHRANQVRRSLISVVKDLRVEIKTDCCIKDGSPIEARSADVIVLVE